MNRYSVCDGFMDVCCLDKTSFDVLKGYNYRLLAQVLLVLVCKSFVENKSETELTAGVLKKKISKNTQKVKEFFF